jgi:hypothetical protein
MSFHLLFVSWAWENYTSAAYNNEGSSSYMVPESLFSGDILGILSEGLHMTGNITWVIFFSEVNMDYLHVYSNETMLH